MKNTEYDKLFPGEQPYWLSDVKKGIRIPPRDPDKIIDGEGYWNAWTMCAYEDRLPQQWNEKIQNLGFMTIISPIHNKDFENGEKKPSHYHIIQVTEEPLSYSEYAAIAKMFTNRDPEIANSVEAIVHYMTHLTPNARNANKAVYDPEKIIFLNTDENVHNFVGERYFNDYKLCAENGCRTWMDFVRLKQN